MPKDLLKKRTAQSTLHPLIQELSRDLRELGDAVVLPAAAFDQWRARLMAFASEDQQDLTGHIVALALRLQEILPGRSNAAILQLARLAHALVGDPVRIAGLFAGLGVDAQELHLALESDRTS